MGLIAVTAFQAVDGVLNGGVQRAQSCTLQQPPGQPRDTHGYLEPVCTPKGRPRYLELIGDTEEVAGAVGGVPATEGATGGPLEPMSQGNKHRAASAPVLNPLNCYSATCAPTPNGPTMTPFTPMYAEINAENLDRAQKPPAHAQCDNRHHRGAEAAASYAPMSLQNGSVPGNGRGAKRSSGNGGRNRSGSNEPFLRLLPPGGAEGSTEDNEDAASDSEHENRRLLGGRERRKSSSPFLRDLSPFIDRRRGTSPLLRDLSPFHSPRRGSSGGNRESTVRYNELETERGNQGNDGYLKPSRNHDSEGYLKPRGDRGAVLGRPPIANGNVRHHGNRQQTGSNH